MVVGKELRNSLKTKTCSSKLNPDLAWLRSVKKETLSTIPVLSPNCSRSVFLTILVASSGNFEQRNAIRSSWAKVYHSGKKKVSSEIRWARLNLVTF